MSYEECKAMVMELPQTWIPAILQELVVTAHEKKVFAKGGIARVVKQLEDSLNAPRHRCPPDMPPCPQCQELDDREADDL